MCAKKLRLHGQNMFTTELALTAPLLSAQGGTMTDRELLELAAKAAGMDGWTWCEEQQCMKSPAKESPYGSVHSYWNPREDDGAALRLAVKLEMDVSIISGDIVAWDRKHSACFEDCNDDPYAATRRAIVRAAAEIGKGMQ